MPRLTQIDRVYHVGTLQLSDRAVARKHSLEGYLLSVSQHPDEWAAIARCANTVWQMDRPGARWLDVYSLDPRELEDITRWGLSEGLVHRGTIFRVWRFDSETENWAFMEFAERMLAQEEADFLLDDAEMEEADDIPSSNGKILDPVDALILTDTGMAAIERWPEPTSARDALTVLWADKVLRCKNPDLMGVWWHETYDPSILSCPRGGIFPDHLAQFHVRSMRGDLPPRSFTERHRPQQA